MNKEELMAKAKAVYVTMLAKAKNLINNPGEITNLINQSKAKLKSIDLVNDLKEIPTLVQMVKHYIRGDYKDLPLGTIVAIVAALIYFVSPIDIIPDVIPVAGYLDDALVITLCLKTSLADVEDFKKWRDSNINEDKEQ